MNENRKKLDKIIAVAVNPGAYEEEAITALRKARALVQENPSLAHPEPVAPPPKSQPAQDYSYQTQITNISALRLPVIMTGLSAEAYGLGLKSKLELEFVEGATRYILNVRVDGPKLGCETFDRYVKGLIEFHNNYHIDGEQ